MIIKTFCPECLEDMPFKEMFGDETWKVLGKEVTINCRRFECLYCHELISPPDNPDENYIKAYDEFDRLYPNSKRKRRS